MTAWTLETISGWLRERGSGPYGGEAVTQQAHALQCATRALADGAGQALITAAFLHDIGHLSDSADDRRHPHERIAARMLESLFPPAVTEPIRMHVDAKRYLCAAEPLYWCGLSEASRRSLEWQGGPFSADEAAAFIATPFAEDAVRLRRWDDAAKVPGAPTYSLDHFLTIMSSQSTESLASA